VGKGRKSEGKGGGGVMKIKTRRVALESDSASGLEGGWLKKKNWEAEVLGFEEKFAYSEG